MICAFHINKLRGSTSCSLYGLERPICNGYTGGCTMMSSFAAEDRTIRHNRTIEIKEKALKYLVEH